MIFLFLLKKTLIIYKSIIICREFLCLEDTNHKIDNKKGYILS